MRGLSKVSVAAPSPSNRVCVPPRKRAREMLKSRGKSTARKPLANISNAGKRSRPGKKKAPSADGDDGGGAIDRLLLARSALSDLVAQVRVVIRNPRSVEMFWNTSRKPRVLFLTLENDRNPRFAFVMVMCNGFIWIGDS